MASSGNNGAAKFLPDRREPVLLGEAPAVATVHPSAVLRAPDREAAYEGFLADLRAAVRAA
ncbi:hypothetical protein [Nonomuraea maritima]|uniref:hypothetical protein n=1 Tax=Nonomuraea maritima TaxID=683260 RepID=UPI0037128608